jgi:hypothetical protein
MTIMRHSGTATPNQSIVDLTAEYAGTDKDNLDFFLDALQRLDDQGVGNKGKMVIGLVGERDLIGVELRRAQSVVRFDHRPSKWSHAFLIAGETPKEKSELAGTKVLEVTMSPRSGVLADPNSNGLTIGRLGNYVSPVVTANAALIAVKMTDAEAEAVFQKATHPNRDRARYNLWDALSVWQGYYWSQGHRPNPLEEGFPMFSSSYVEYAFEGIDLDVTPSASERNSAPDHLYSAAKYWNENMTDLNHPMFGYLVVRDPGCAVLYQDEVKSAADVVARVFEDEASAAGAVAGAAAGAVAGAVAGAEAAAEAIEAHEADEPHEPAPPKKRAPRTRKPKEDK